MSKKVRVLFLCTHNSARSQMAEGYLRHAAGERFEAASAGTEVTSVRPEAREAMAKIGVDISGQESKILQRYLGEPFDYVVTVCDDAGESCPAFPGQPRGRTGRCRTRRPPEAMRGEVSRLPSGARPSPRTHRRGASGGRRRSP